jgi:hypothetical protein
MNAHGSGFDSTEGGISKFRRGYDTGTFAKVAVDSPDRSSMIEKDAKRTHEWIWLSIAQIIRKLGRMAVGCVHNRKKSHTWILGGIC